MTTIRALVRTALAAGLCCVVAVPAVLAQDQAVSKQEKAHLEFAKLQESMQRLQVTLAETSPDESNVLRVGNQFVQEKRIPERMVEIREQLKQASWDEALEGMTAVKKDLAVLMSVLLNRDMDLKALLEEIAKLEGFKKRVDTLIADQQREKENAARSEALKKHLEDLEKAKAEIEALMRDQAALRDATNKVGLQAAAGQAAKMAKEQGDLEDKADQLGDDMKKLEKENRELTKPAAGKDGPKPGNDSKGKAGSAGSCSGSCKGAGASMGKAKQKLSKNSPERSLEDMDQAMRKLEQAKKALADMAEQARRELLQMPFEEQAKKQETTRIDTDRLAQDMEQAGKGQDGKPNKPTPGTDNVQQAVPKQKAAAGQLKEYQPGKAKQNQQDAKEDLEQAKKKLEDALAQLRQQLQDEVLRALEERFGAMLAKQKEITASTRVTDRLRGESLTADGALPAALASRIAKLAGGELDLASEAGDALKLLEEEGTTAVFPELVVELKEDLERVAGRLDAEKTGVVTQNMQAEIEDTLRMLIDALRRTIEDGDGQCGQCNGEPPLVPMSAELKLILQLQKRVYKRTKTYDSDVPEAERGSEAAVAEAREIARKQGRVRQLTRKLAVKQNKENQANDGR